MAVSSAQRSEKQRSGQKRASYSVGVAKVPAVQSATAKPSARQAGVETAAAGAESTTAVRSTESPKATRHPGLTRRLFGGQGRVIGLDTARGIGVVAMVAGLAGLAVPASFGQNPAAIGSQAVGANAAATSAATLTTASGSAGSAASTGVQLLDPSSWAGLLGSGSLLVLAGVVFTVVAGASASLLSGGYEGLDGVAQLRARLRTLARAVIFVLGGFATLATGYLVGRFGSGAWFGAWFGAWLRAGAGTSSGAPAASGGAASPASFLPAASSSLFGSVVAVTVPAALFAGGLLICIGLLTLAELVFARCGSALLFAVAVGCALITPTVAIVVSAHVRTPVVDAICVFAPWVCLFVAGMGIGRLRLDLLRVRWLLFGGGALLAVLAFGCAWLMGRFAGSAPTLETAGVPHAVVSELYSLVGADALADAAAHGLASFVAGPPPSPLVVLGLGGSALALVALGLVLGHALRWVLLPLSAAGSLALSIGATAVVAMCVVAVAATGSPVTTSFFGFAARLDSIAVPGARWHWLVPAAAVGAVLVLAVLWRLAFGAGLLERLLSAVSRYPGRSVFIADAPPATAQTASLRTATLPPPLLAPQPPVTPSRPTALLTPAEAPPAPLAPPAPAPTPAEAAPAASVTPPAPTAAPAPAESAPPPAAAAPPTFVAPPVEPTASAPPEPKPEPPLRTPPTISPVRSTWSPGQTLGRLPY